FDPVELYAYYVGLTVNHRLRGIHLKYTVAMPTGWTPERRQSVLIAFRRGIFRSLPAGMIEYHDVDRLVVVDAGPAAIPFREPAPEEPSELLAHTPEARANVQILKDLVRPLLEQGPKVRIPGNARVTNTDGEGRDIYLTIDREALAAAIEEWLREGIAVFKDR